MITDGLGAPRDEHLWVQVGGALGARISDKEHPVRSPHTCHIYRSQHWGAYE